MFKKLLFVGFFHLLILPYAFAFGDFFKKIDDAFENLNEVLEETEKPIKKESLQQKKSPVIKKESLQQKKSPVIKKDKLKNNLPNQNNSRSNIKKNPSYGNQPKVYKQTSPSYENQSNYNNQMNPTNGNQLEVIENEVDF